jgi:hypothetical protein
VDGKKAQWKESLLINGIPLFGSVVREEGKIVLGGPTPKNFPLKIGKKVAIEIQINKIPKITLLLMD